MHVKYTDVTYFDMMLVQLIDIMTMILSLSPKEVILYFIKEENVEMSKVLAKHVFFSNNDGLVL
jgi:hypothetical protein